MGKSKRLKDQRRRREVLKAHAKSSIRGQFIDKVAETVGVEEASQPKKLDQRLHTKEIKKDLIKTGIFAVLVIVFLIVLKAQSLELNFSIYK